MALIYWMDSYDHDNNAATNGRYGSATADVSTITPFGSGNSLQLLTSGVATAVIPANPSFIWGGMFIRPGDITSQPIAYFRSSAAVIQSSLWFNSIGRLAVRRGTSTEIGSESTSSITAIDVWRYISWKITVSDSLAPDDLQIYVENKLVYTNAGGEDAREDASNADIGDVQIKNSGSEHIDELWLANEDIGIARVINKKPLAAGYLTEFSTNAASNLLAVNSTLPDDVTYNNSGTPGHIDAYTVEPVAIGTTIAGIAVYCRISNDGAGTGRVGIRVAGVNYWTDELFPTMAFQSATPYIFSVNPATGLDWEAVDYNAIEVLYGVMPA